MKKSSYMLTALPKTSDFLFTCRPYLSAELANKFDQLHLINFIIKYQDW